MLKEIVDETSQGRYDFMYLRIGKYLILRRSPFLLTHHPQTLRIIAS